MMRSNKWVTFSKAISPQRKLGGCRSWLKLFVTQAGGRWGGGRPRRANKAFRESLRTLIDAISSDASKLHTFLAAVFSSVISFENGIL